MSDDKCKGCQWHNKPYWSIINPCDNCPRENTNVEIITRWQDPTIEELKTQLQQKENIIKEVREYCKNKIQEQKDMKDFSKYYLEGYDKAISATYSTHSGILLETIKSTTIKRYESILEILDKGE